MFKQISLLVLFGLLSVSAFATHIMGGTLSYKYVSSTTDKVTYEITLQMYRDCRGGVSTTVQFDPEIKIGIYHNNSSRTKYKTEVFNVITKRIVPLTSCYDIGVNFCVEAGTYTKNVTFDKSTVGYFLAYEVCCRFKLDNLKDGVSMPENGFTFMGIIPPTHIINNSPVYDFNPNLVNGLNTTIEDYWGATDKDGDSLVYSIVAPYKGGTPSVGQWEPPSNLTDPVSVDYVNGYTYTKPLGNAGTISIDQTTGKLIFLNSNTGTYAFCIEIKEYRKGVLIGFYRKDYPLIFINIPPDIKTNLRLLNPQFVTYQSISLSWQICPNVFPIYTIERKEKNKAWAKIGETKIRDNYIDTIANNIMYYYRVKAIINSTEYVSNMDSAYITHNANINISTANPISIYPNPAKDYLNFKNSSFTSYIIYDITGKMLLESKDLPITSETKVDVRSLKPGLYFILITTDKGLVSERFVKE